MARMFEIAFQLAGRVNSSFNSAFGNANAQLEQMNDNAAELQDQSDGLASMLVGVGKAAAGIGLAAGAAGLTVGGLAVNISDDLQKSLNGVQSATGIADEAMGGMKGTMLAIYNNNFGESFEEIGNVMGLVTQQTGLAGDALQKMTEGAFTLKDTFEMDVAGSVETAGVMMKNFGIDSDQAYNMIAQGAQNGLNKQGDLLDILKEYGPHFASLGFSAEESMNMLKNGAAGGVFSVDQLGDVVHEFGRKMREEDLSEPLQELGLNSEKYTGMVAKGGETAKKAFGEIAAKVAAIKDPVKQNQIGIGIFGDMMGEVGIEGVLAMSNTKGAIDKTKDALGKINSVKYNTFGEAMTGIKRNLETGILIPLGDQIMPKMNEFAGWITGNMPAIKNEISYAMDTAAAVFGKVSTFIGTEVVPRFKNIGYIASDIADSIFPNLDGAGNGLLTTMEGLVTGGLNIVIDALKFVRDNSDLVKTAVEIAGVTFLAYQGALVSVTIATNLHTIAQNIQKGAIVAYNIAVGIATAAQWGYLIAMESGSIGLGVIAAAQWLFNAALTANPIGVVIVSLTALGVGIYALVKNWDSVTGAIEKAWNWLTKWNDTPSESKTTEEKVESKWSETNDAYAKQYGYANDHSERVAEKHAWGGIMTSPHLGLVAEAGPEAIVPLSNRSRGLEVWNQAGKILGADTQAASPFAGLTGGNASSGGNAKISYDINVNVNGVSGKDDFSEAIERAKVEIKGVVRQEIERLNGEKRRVAYDG